MEIKTKILRTLKDLEEVCYRNITKSHSCSLTWKDMTNTLKQEAVKWIKYLNQDRKIKMYESLHGAFNWTDEEIRGAEIFIRMFFNITESDFGEFGMKPARELLKEAKIGDIIKFKDGVEGAIINGDKIDKKYVVDNKAILLTKFSSGGFWGVIAIDYLNVPARIRGAPSGSDNGNQNN